jgi:hypothetical protein
MEVQAVAARRGWQWIVEGYRLFRLNALTWVAITVALAVLWMASLMIPLLGPLLFNLLSPVFCAGLMIGCRALERGEKLEVLHLFAGFRQQAAQLVTVGGVYLVGTILVVGLVFYLGEGSKLSPLLSKAGTDLEAMREATRMLGPALVVGAAAYLPLLMLIWFAPLLVVFDGLRPVDAMRISFFACLMNTLPFLVYGAAILALWLALSLPAALGAAGAVLVIVLLVASIPVLFCSIYASYKDVFMRNLSAPGPTNS